jgi:hypothetical protein
MKSSIAAIVQALIEVACWIVYRIRRLMGWE